MNKIIVKTKRLAILPKTIEEMVILRDNETDAEMKQAYTEMLETMHMMPGHEEWGSDWKICLEDENGMIVGGIGFKGIPDANGIVEIGYGIDEQYRCNGYATEAVAGMAKWALNQDGVKLVAAQTLADNEISQKVLLKNGFIRDGFGDEGPLFKIQIDNVKAI